MNNRVCTSLLVALFACAPAAAFAEEPKREMPASLGDDQVDWKAQGAHEQAWKDQTETAGPFADGLMARAADAKLDLKAYVNDAQKLTQMGSAATQDDADALVKNHQATVAGVEKAIGLPGLFSILKAGGQGQGPTEFVPLGGQVGGGFCGSCRKIILDAPHQGSFHGTYPLGAAAISPDPVSELSTEYSAAVAWAGHSIAKTGEVFDALPGDRLVTATATMDLTSDIGVGGLGLAHGWTDVQLVVIDTATGAETCRVGVETGNLAAGAWYSRNTNHLGTRTIGECRFVRDPASSGHYDVNIELRAWGTYGGLAGGFARLDAKFQNITVELCP